MSKKILKIKFEKYIKIIALKRFKMYLNSTKILLRIIVFYIYIYNTPLKNIHK